MSFNVKLSVHQIVDFLLRKGDIDDRVFNKETMQEGTKIHSRYQKKQASNYLAEYLLNASFDIDNYHIKVEGRADGIINEDIPIIDEIKTTNSELKIFYEKHREWHLAQAMFYAYMFLTEKKLDVCKIRLTYISQVNDDKKIYEFKYNLKDLEIAVLDLLNKYIIFFKNFEEYKMKRNDSCKTLKFPFKEFRAGQNLLAKQSYKIAKNGGILFVEAPTGIGKTISTLYPFVYSFKDNINEKIFYLTAKTSGKQSAFEAMQILKSKGLIAKDITISAKEKICFCKNAVGCNPDNCPYAKDYYNKISNVIIESLIKYDTFNIDSISQIANTYSICPFEFQLDLSIYCDVIICDYNYFFDPIVYMQRYFQDYAPSYLVLVDEAHNLLDRGRDMYSMILNMDDYIELKKSLKIISDIKETKKLKNGIKRILKMFSRYLTNEETFINELSHDDELDLLYMQQAFLAIKESKDFNKINLSQINTMSRDLNRFIKLYEIKRSYDYVYFDKNGKNISLNLKAIDVKSRLRASLQSVKGSVVFSATLSPIDYFVDVIGGDQLDPVLKLKSPFNKNNLEVLVAPKISVKYKNREKTYEEVSEYIKSFVSNKIGNYLIYVPSFEYLDNISSYLEDNLTFQLIKQEKGFDDIRKSEFLESFSSNPTKTTVGLTVIGGSFSEGIDLIDDRLIGVVIVGVGLPQICFERDLIKDYYNKGEDKRGFEYAYINPGINKILQASGRVIRSENDKGAVLLIDDRYLYGRHLELLSSHYSQYKVIYSKEEINKILNIFWNK